jgi:hypothetical protein
MTNDPAETPREPLRALDQDLRALVAQEVRKVRNDLGGTLREAGTGGALIAAAGVLGALAAGSSAALALRALDRVLPPVASAAVLTALLGSAAAGLAAAGARELRSVPPLLGAAAEQVRHDARVATDAARGAVGES